MSTIFLNVLIAIDGTPIDAYQLLRTSLQKEGISFVTDAFEELAANGEITRSGDTSELHAGREPHWQPWPLPPKGSQTP